MELSVVNTGLRLCLFWPQFLMIFKSSNFIPSKSDTHVFLWRWTNDACTTSAGDVDGPLEVLLLDDDACRPGLGLWVLLLMSLLPYRGGDEVALLSADRQVERAGRPQVQKRLCILRGRVSKGNFIHPKRKGIATKWERLQNICGTNKTK